MMRIPGLHEAMPGELVNLIFHDPNEDGSLTVTSLYSPTREEVEREIRARNLPMGYTLRVINERDPAAHTVIFDMPRFMEHLKEMGLKL